jgi:hypothetical protein
VERVLNNEKHVSVIDRKRAKHNKSLLKEKKYPNFSKKDQDTTDSDIDEYWDKLNVDLPANLTQDLPPSTAPTVDEVKNQAHLVFHKLKAYADGVLDNTTIS